MSTDNDDLQKVEIRASVSTDRNTYAGAQGDYHYLPESPTNTNRIRLDSMEDKNEHLAASSVCEIKLNNDFRSNFASGEPEQYQKCLPASSATFIVASSSPSPSEILIPENIQSIHHLIHPTNNPELCTSAKASSNHQQWWKERWIPVTTIAGLLTIVMMTVTISIIYG